MKVKALKAQNPYMRLIFLFSFFALSIGDAFNVLFIKQMAEGVAPEGRLELFVSIPVTLMSAMMIAGVVFSNFLVRKNKDIVSFIRISAIITIVGMLVRSAAFHYIVLTVGFMLAGFGYGCFYIGLRYYAYLFTDDNARVETMAFISGGAFAGQCMGTVLGGIMAGQIPYRMVYLLSTVFLVTAVALTYKLNIDEKLEIGSLGNSLKAAANPRAVIYVVFIVIPLFACTIFTSYTVPLEIDGFGYSATVISALLLAAYIISGYAGPFMTKMMLSLMHTINATFVYCSGVALLILIYTLKRSFGLLILVVLLLGLLDSFGLNVMTEAYSQRSRSSKYSDTDALMLYILITRVGMTIAPTIILVFGTTIALSGMMIAGMAIFLLAGTVINAKTIGHD